MKISELFKKRYAYADSGELLLDGSAYEGFFNINNGVFTTGKYRTDKSKLLTSNNKIECDYYQSKYFKDRKISDSLLFPYTRENILVPANESISYTAFNSVLNRVYENTIFLYSKLFIASNNIPSGETFWAGVSADIDVSTATEILTATADGGFDLKWHAGEYIADTVSSNEVGLNDLDLIRRFDNIQTNDGNNIIFACTGTKLITLSSDSAYNTINVTFSGSKIDSNKTLEFKNIVDVCIEGKKMFIADSSNNTIFKYDISNFFSDGSTDKKLLLEESVGGAIDRSNQKNLFSNIERIESADDTIYVHDSGANIVRVFDSFFSWIADIKITGKNEKILACKYNKFNDILFVLSSAPRVPLLTPQGLASPTFRGVGSSIYYINTFNKSGSIQYEKFEIQLEDNINKYETSIEFSTENSNVFYIQTTSNIFKYFISNFSEPIGKWQIENTGISLRNIWNLIDDLSYSQVTVNWDEMKALSVFGGDNIIARINDFTISESGKFDRIFAALNVGTPKIVNIQGRRMNTTAPIRFISVSESTVFDTILKTTDINIYTKDKIGPEINGYIGPLSINSEIYKQIYNLFQLKSLLKGRFIGEYDINGDLLYKQYEYTSFDSIKSIDTNNLYIHENEHLSVGNINRCLNIIFDLQEDILNIINTKVKNLYPIK